MEDNQNIGVHAAAPLTDRVNSQPPILKGLTSGEVSMATFVTIPFWFVIALLIAVATGMWMVLLILGVCGPLGTVWLGAGYMAKLKRNRPDHYHQHLAKAWLHKAGLRSTRFLDHLGSWDLGRSMPQIASRKESVLERAQHFLRYLTH